VRLLDPVESIHLDGRRLDGADVQMRSRIRAIGTALQRRDRGLLEYFVRSAGYDSSQRRGTGVDRPTTQRPHVLRMVTTRKLD
jgi:hypothetical protein